MPELPRHAATEPARIVRQRLPKPPYAGLFQEPALPAAQDFDDDFEVDDQAEFKTGF